MKRSILILVKEVPNGAFDLGSAGKIANGCRVDIDTAYAAKPRLQAADTRRTLVEALGTTAKAAEQMEVPELDINIGDGHAILVRS